MSRNKVVHKKIKHEIRFTQDMLIKRIAQETSLTQPQVKECMDKMFDIIETVTLHPDCPTIFEFKMGSIGKITLRPHMGRKAGTYKRPNNFKKGDIIEEIVEAEEPSFQNLAFEMFPAYQSNLSEISKERASRQSWFKTEIVGVDADGNKIKEIKQYKGWKARAGSYYPLDYIDEVK